MPYAGASRAIVDACRFEKNVANNHGGGMYLDNTVHAQISDSVFKDNMAARGGAVALRLNARVLMERCDVTGMYVCMYMRICVYACICVCVC